ncbi:MAG: hypothetical protein V2I36_11555, partial [Desulfopila sp.]|nr:hypothetical protein [Desulfopila sp.]
MDINARREHIVFSDINNSTSDDPSSNNLQYQHNIVDILRTAPSQISFVERIKKIGLSQDLEDKVLLVESHGSSPPPIPQRLLESDEKELAGEMLLRRHTFTRLIFENNFFRQAALTIIQNIYLFRQRKIFFGTPTEALGDRERQ